MHNLLRAAAIGLYVGAVVSSTILAQSPIPAEEVALKPQIDEAIADGVEALIDAQHRDGSWGLHGNMVGGKAGLAAYTLLKCGVRREHPVLQRAFAYLDATEPEQTYAVACMMLAYVATGDKRRYRGRVDALLQKLLATQKNSGDWGYPKNRPDLSNVQYAALGLWSAHKFGLKVHEDVWVDLARAAMRYQEEIRRVKVPPEALPPGRRGRTSTGSKLRVGGFGYLAKKGTKEGKPSGSMTTAGTSILEVCRIGLGSKLRGELRQELDASADAGRAWLAANFAVDKNPGKGGWLYYYLYGLERVCSLSRVERLGTHSWYLEGARFLLEKQQGKGHWPGLDGVNTCFALLFLRRATALKGPTTGGSGLALGDRHSFAAGGRRADLLLRGAGQQPLLLWIDRFGDAVIRRHEKHGIRVVDVSYARIGNVAKGAEPQILEALANIAADPTKVWDSDTFLHRCAALPRGEHFVEARVTLVAADVEPGVAMAAEEPPTETLVSPAMRVEVRDVFEPWMATAARLRRDNLLRGQAVEAVATSNQDGAPKVHDGVDGTAWVCATDDAAPSIELKLAAIVRAQRVLIAQPPVHVDDVPKFDRIVEVELRFNGSSKGLRYALDPDPCSLSELMLPKTLRLRSIAVIVTERKGATGKAGFAEIGLGAALKKRGR